MAVIPQEPGFDSTRALLADPYRFIGRRCRAHNAPFFRTRILLRRTICMSGPQAAQLFYDPQRFERRGATPEPVRATLFGKGGVQGLDGEAHRSRKRMLLDLLAPSRARDLARATERQWQTQASRWAGCPRVVLYDELQRLLTRAVYLWAGMALEEAEVPDRTRELVALFDQAAAVGVGHLQARRDRQRLEQRMQRFIEDVREGRARVEPGRAAHTIAWHREPDGRLLEPRVAAIELLNVLRPTVANAVFVVFAAHALERNPQCRQRIAAGDDDYLERFVQEVRRFYPFFPAVVARVRDDFDWQGYEFYAGERVMLDLYGTNHDPSAWDAPETFDPERFRVSNPSPFELVPQGGGEHTHGHRCPGEWMTIEIMKTALAFLTRELRYSVPQQDLAIAFDRMPALPRSRMVIADVRRRGACSR